MTSHEESGGQVAPLFDLFVAGAFATCDAWAADPYPLAGLTNSTRWLLAMASFIGPPSTVRGIGANLRTAGQHNGATILSHDPNSRNDTNLHNLGLHLMPGANYYSAPLNALQGYRHVIAMAAQTPATRMSDKDDDDINPDESFYIFSHSPDDAPAIFYREFAKRSPTPTLPEWTEPLWELCLARGEIRPLRSSGIHGWRCDMRYQALEAKICEALASGTLLTPGV